MQQLSFSTHQYVCYSLQEGDDIRDNIKTHKQTAIVAVQFAQQNCPAFYRVYVNGRFINTFSYSEQAIYFLHKYPLEK